MSLLREIQDATSNPEIKLSDLLRKCKILAVRLEHKPFKSWVNSELNGYSHDDNLPTYRILRNIESSGDFYGPYGSGVRNAHIASLYIPKEYREDLTTIHLYVSISSLESIIEQAHEPNIRFTWSANILMLIRPKVYQYLECATAWRVVSVNSLVAILDTVKTRVLDFALEIEAEAPEAGEAKPGTKPIPDQSLTQIFNQCVLHQNNHTASNGYQIITDLQQELIMSDNRSTNINAGRDAIGNVGGDNSGSISNTLSQQTDAEINEILKLIESLHQEIEAISPENQDVAADSLETLEAEVVTPTKPAKLKSALFALWSVGKDVASFANALSAIAERLGIHLHG